MGSCPVCYEAFSSDSDGTIPRKLPCEHVVCTQCTTESWEEDDEGTGVRCPECFELFRFDSLESVPVYDRSAEGEDTQDAPEIVEDASAETGNVPKASPQRNNKLTAFLSTQKEDSVEDFDQSEGEDDFMEEDEGAGGIRVCKKAGCGKEVVGNAPVCPEHTKRLSVVSVSAMVHKFQDTKLSSVALKSDKVEVKRGSAAGNTENRFDPDEIAERFKRQERLELGEAVELIEAVKNILREYDNMVELESPVLVVGDVHGQYFDLLKILQMWRPDTRLLFLGDYVDRGQFSCEVILHLFALKLRYPDKVHLIRGNHECSSVSAHFGFKDECKAKYGLTVYYRFLLAFQTMPICALISTKRGRIFACHGGISPDVTSLSDIENIDRFAEPEMDGPLCDMLWADPMNEDDNHKLTEDEYKEFLDTDYIANQVRGCSYMFGYHAVERFLRENRLMYMVRAHEVQEHGFRSHFSSPEWALAAAEVAAREDDFTDEDSEIDSDEEHQLDGDADGSSYDKVLEDTSRHLSPTVLTVFSAPNYCDRYQNKAAVLFIDEGGFYIVNLLHAEPHPDPVQETDMNVMQLLAMGKTCPYMPTSFREFLKVAVQLGRAVKPSSANHSLAADDIVASATAAMVAADAAADEAAVAASAPSVQQASVSAENREPLEVAASGGFETEDEGSGDRRGAGVFTPERPSAATYSEEDSGQRLPTCPPVRPPDGSRKVLRGFSNPVLAASAGWRKSSLSSVSSSVLLEEGGGRSEGEGGGGGEEAPGRRVVESEEKAEVSNARRSFLGAMSSLSKRSMRGLGLLEAMSLNQSVGALTRQNAWTTRGDGSNTPTEARSKQFHKAQARDGINEMHPEVLDRRISAQESEASGRRSTGFTAPSLEGLLFGPAGLKRQPSGTHPAARAREDKAKGGDGENREDPCPAPPSRGIRRQCTLKMSLATSRSSSERMRESKSRDELAAMMSSKSIADLAQMDRDVELEFDGCGSDGAAASDSEFGPTGSLDNGGASSLSRCSSFDREHGMVTPSPRSRKSSLGESSPSQMLFTHEEIVVLKLLFSLFDRKSKNFITRDDIVAYAEEGGDYAQLKEVDACMEAIDADMDGKVGLSDYINFAARLKEIHSLQQTQEASVSDTGEGLMPSQEAGEE